MKNVTDSVMVDLMEMAAQVRLDYPDQTHVYIAIMPSAQDGEYWLEVEVVPEAEIGASFDTGSNDLAYARALAHIFDDYLVKRGLTVLKTRQEWESLERWSRAQGVAHKPPVTPIVLKVTIRPSTEHDRQQILDSLEDITVDTTAHFEEMLGSDGVEARITTTTFRGDTGRG